MLRVRGIDDAAQEVHTEAGAIRYDHLVLATGTRANFFGNKNMEKYALPLKTVPHARQLRHHLFQTLERVEMTEDPRERASMMTFLIVGGGPSGVELAGALSELRRHVLQRDYHDTDTMDLRFILVDGGQRLLSQFSEKSSADALKNLEEMGIEMIFEKLVKDYDGRTVTFNDDTTLETHTVIWGAGVTGEIIQGLKEGSAEKAHYVIDDRMRVKDYNNVFAIGDVTYLTSDKWLEGHPGVAQVAIQMGKRLAKNFNALAKGKEPEGFVYNDKGNLAIIGRNRAVADLPRGIHLNGFPAWFIWAVVHIFYLIGFRNRLFTFLSWVGNYITYNRAVRLVIEPSLEEELKEEKDDGLATDGHALIIAEKEKA
jgi:NADH dehydrogenase